MVTQIIHVQSEHVRQVAVVHIANHQYLWRMKVVCYKDIFIILITLAIDIAIDEYKRGSVNLVIDPQKMK